MRDEGLYFDDILEAAEHIQRFLDDVSFEQFLDSELLQSAVVQKLTVIGEAASRISESSRSAYPYVNWRSIRGFRNIAVHVYYQLDWMTVWETATRHVPILSKQISEIIDKDFPFPDEGDGKRTEG